MRNKIRLTESELTKIIKKIIKEDTPILPDATLTEELLNKGFTQDETDKNRFTKSKGDIGGTQVVTLYNKSLAARCDGENKNFGVGSVNSAVIISDILGSLDACNRSNNVEPTPEPIKTGIE